MRTASLVLIVAVLGAPSVAVGQDVVESVSKDRSGLIAGASIGRGSIDIECAGCGNVDAITEGLSVTASAGFFLHPRLALVGEYWTVRYNDRGSAWFKDNQEHRVVQHITGVAAQLWLLRSIWLKAGLGVGHHESRSPLVRGGTWTSSQRPLTSAEAPPPVPPKPPQSSNRDDYDPNSPAYFTAVGWEYAANDVFAADVQLRFGASKNPTDNYEIYNTSINFGFSWY